VEQAEAAKDFRQTKHDLMACRLRSLEQQVSWYRTKVEKARKKVRECDEAVGRAHIDLAVARAASATEVLSSAGYVYSTQLVYLAYSSNRS
jgi:hypothetical protein